MEMEMEMEMTEEVEVVEVTREGAREGELIKIVKVQIPNVFEKEVTYIDVEDRLLAYLVSKCYMRVEGLLKSKPWNIIERLRKRGRMTVKIGGEEFETVIYEWYSNTKMSKVLVFTYPADDKCFILLPDKDVLVRIPLGFISSYYQ